MVIGVLGHHIDSELMIETIRHKVERMGSSLREIFDKFDWLNKGFLTVSEIRRHFSCYPDETQSYKMGGNLDFNADIELLIRRVNKDKFNGRISLIEWLDELTPVL